MDATLQSSLGDLLETSGNVDAEVYVADLSARAMLRDGTAVCVRAIRPDDKERLRIAFRRLSARSVYQRFFHPITELTDDVLRHLTELDFRDHVGLALTIRESSAERLIAVGRFVRVAPGADRAELAVTVADEYQHRGAATLLLRHLVGVARDSGVRELVADVLDENRQMLELIQNSKLPLQETIACGVRRIVLCLDTETSLCR